MYMLKINGLIKRLSLMKNIQTISDGLSIGFSRIVLHVGRGGGKSERE